MGDDVKRARGALALSVFIAIMMPVAWCMLMLSRSDIALTAVGLYSLKYFTVLSNLLLAVASLVYAVCLVRFMRSGARVPHWAYLLKYAGTVATTVTLMTVLLFLGPTLGYPLMFVGGNLWLHLIIPVAGIVEFVFFDVQYSLSFKEMLVGVVPTLLYGIAYCANILINGVGTFPNTNDWYGFTMWGVQYMPVVLAAMLLATWLLAVLIRLGNIKANHLG